MPADGKPPPPTAEDVAFVERCADRAVAGLPEPLRRGVATARAGGAGGYFAYCVPPDLWDGAPDADGLVRWRRRTVAAPRPAFAPDLYQRDTPPVLKAYLRTQRLPRLPLPAGDLVLMLPGTPTHQPLHDFRRVVERGVHLISAADYLPFAESDDGSWLFCLDRQGAQPGEDAPVVAFRAEDVFRITPRLLAARGRHDAVRGLSRPLFGSLRELFDVLCLGGRFGWTGREPCPYARPALDRPAPYDWGPWLEPQPAPDREAPPQRADDIDPRAVADHCARIADKVRLLARLDPACLMPGSEEHLHRMHPQLLPDERSAFEGAEGCSLPEAYAGFLMRVGNGGAGIWKGLWRVERSGGFWTGMRERGNEDCDNRLRRPFPHRTAWAPPAPDDEDEEAYASYHDPRRVDGTAYLGRIPDPQGHTVELHLVVNGPEQGHVWADHRSSGAGIVPILRGGPYSFLAWYEQGLDRALALIDDLYREVADEARASKP